MRLDQLECGQGGVIESLQGQASLVQRLMAMAFLPGAAVEVVQVAPFGGTITVRLPGSQISLRKSVAQSVFVRV